MERNADAALFSKTGDSRFQPQAHHDFDYTVAMLNETMGTCI